MPIPSFDLGVLQSISDVLGATDHGFSGSEIGRYLRECNIHDPFPTHTKRLRIFEALKEKQTIDGCGNHVAAFIQYSMNPVRHHDAREWFEDTRSKLNHVLAFAGLELRDNGKLHQVEKAETHSQAVARASTLREHLLIRKVHPDVLRYCREELLVDNYFHAVFEATKSVADKIRTLSGLTSDGSGLVDEVFSFKSAIPFLALSSLRTESEQSEQKGFMNLLKGLFGTFRNTTAHAPKITWKIEEQDALDILSLVSLVHRRLDSATRARAVYEGKV
ncbi:MAG: TIGR02391 family protein [Rhodoferax sp.]|nr:TIGR02391 family protein [Rhodoferax sp.]